MFFLPLRWNFYSKWRKYLFSICYKLSKTCFIFYLDLLEPKLWLFERCLEYFIPQKATVNNPNHSVDHNLVIYKQWIPKQLQNVYFSICFFSKKTINTYLKLKIRVACREFLAFKYVVIVFFETKQMIIYICTSEILKTHV